MTQHQRRLIAVDLFAGAGGFSLGIEQAGFDVLVAVEYDPIHACTYSFNFPLTEVLCANVSTVTGEMIKQTAYRSWAAHHAGSDVKAFSHNLLPSSSWDGKIDLVFGGPPCQGFSMMGKRELEDSRNNLVFHFFRLVTELNPRYFVMENVPGMAAGKYKSWLSELVSNFEAAGYNVQQEILNAAHFGVPQKRLRLFVIGTHSELGINHFPFNLSHTDNASVTVRDAIADLPDLDNFAELKTSDEVLLSPPQLQELLDKSSPYVQMLRGKSKTNLCYPRLWNPQMLTSSMQTQHKDSSKIRFGEILPGELEPISRLRRLDLNGLSHTLRAGTDYFRGAHTSPRPIHPTFPRVISVREAARLHSFPDWFRFHQTKWHGFRQVGNAVPPLLAQAVGEKIIANEGVIPSIPQSILPLGNTQLLQFTPTEAKNYLLFSGKYA